MNWSESFENSKLPNGHTSKNHINEKPNGNAVSYKFASVCANKIQTTIFPALNAKIISQNGNTHIEE